MGGNKAEQSILQDGERIGIQTGEGPCSAGCAECYERDALKEILRNLDHDAVDKKSILQTPIEAFSKYFKLCATSGIKELFLIGSEPTEHKDFDKILGLAKINGCKLWVYTGGGNLRALHHESVNHVVLHVNYGKGTLDGVCTPEFMREVNDLLATGVTIDCRVNFSSEDMHEKSLIFSFYEGVNSEHRKNVCLKYSFNAKTPSSDNHVTPDKIKAITNNLIHFIDDFHNQFPEVTLFTERPIFPCAFEDGVWDKYAEMGGFRAKCDMEYTFYYDGLGLCPPARRLVSRIPVETPDQLKLAIEDLREKLSKVKFGTLSFAECVECRHRASETCQGGCSCYKEESAGCSKDE